MKVNMINSLVIVFDINEESRIHKGDLLVYKGDTYKVYELVKTPTEYIVKLELVYRAVDIFIINGKLIKAIDYNDTCFNKG